MPRKRLIQLVGKRAAFNAEAWARAVEALARQLQREAQSDDATDKPQASDATPETSS